MKSIVLAVAIVLFAAAAAPVGAQTTPSGLIYYQGVLRDAGDQPLSGSFDMVFRFYGEAVGGDEILVDSHVVGSGGTVVADRGLFSVELGGGVIADGSGPGAYTSLAQVFRDYPDVWLSIEVSHEVLDPRTHVLPTAWALNSGALGGHGASEFPRLSASNVFTGGEQIVQIAAPDARGTVVQSSAGQTANLSEWRNATGQLVASVSPSGAITGAGPGLTNLDASQLTTGMVPDSRLSPDLMRAGEWDSTAEINQATQDADFLTNNGATQTLTAAKTIAMGSGTTLTLSKTTTESAETFRVLDSAAVRRLGIGEFGGPGAAILKTFDATGTARTTIDGFGVLNSYDGSVTGVGVNVASSPTWTGTHEFDGMVTFGIAPAFNAGFALPSGQRINLAPGTDNFSTAGALSVTPTSRFPGTAVPPAWQASRAYTAGASGVSNDSGKQYRCIASGTSAPSGGPTGTGADIPDGTVHWTYLGSVHSGMATWRNFLYQPIDTGNNYDGLNGDDSEFIWMMGYNVNGGAGERQDTTEYSYAMQFTNGWTRTAPLGRNGEWFITHVTPKGYLWHPWAVNVDQMQSESPAFDLTVSPRPRQCVGGSWAGRACSKDADCPSSTCGPFNYGLQVNTCGVAVGGPQGCRGDLEVKNGGFAYLGGISGGTVRYEGNPGGAVTDVQVINPTANRLIRFPDASGTVLLTAGAQEISGENSFDNPNNRFSGDGSGLTGVSAVTLGGVPGSSFLRRDASDTFTGETLAMAKATVLDVGGTIQLAGSMFMKSSGPDADQSIFFFDRGVPDGEAFRWNDAASRFETTNTLLTSGDLAATGQQSFVQNDPTDAGLAVLSSALSGDENATFTRGSDRLDAGVARVHLGEAFGRVTNPEIGLTAFLTPRAAGAHLWVQSISTTELVVRGDPGTPPDALFDFIVMGLRIGFEDAPVVLPRTTEGGLPSGQAWDALYQARPELKPLTAGARYRAMPVPPTAPEGAAAALREAVGTQDDAGTQPAPARSTARRAPTSTAPAAIRSSEAATPPAPAIASVRAGWSRSGGEDQQRFYPVSEPVEMGDVLVADPNAPGYLRRGGSAEDPGVVGIVAGSIGVALEKGIVPMSDVDPELAERLARAQASGTPDEAARVWSELQRRSVAARAPVAFTGIVMCNVDATHGSIRRGDLLTASPMPGHAMRSSSLTPGTIVGKALADLAEGTGRIPVLAMQR